MADQIVLQLIQALRNHLEIKLQMQVREDDPVRATIVKIGRFQDNPTRENVYVAVSGGDPENPDYRDGIVTLGDMQNIGFNVPPREVGGGQLWWRRGVIQFGCFFVREGYDEEESAEYAYTFLGRISANVENLKVTHLVDDYGERAIKLFLWGNTFFESGGSGKFIWRGKALWSALTERP